MKRKSASLKNNFCSCFSYFFLLNIYATRKKLYIIIKSLNVSFPIHFAEELFFPLSLCIFIFHISLDEQIIRNEWKLLIISCLILNIFDRFCGGFLMDFAVWSGFLSFLFLRLSSIATEQFKFFSTLVNPKNLQKILFKSSPSLSIQRKALKVLTPCQPVKLSNKWQVQMKSLIYIVFLPHDSPI